MRRLFFPSYRALRDKARLRSHESASGCNEPARYLTQVQYGFAIDSLASEVPVSVEASADLPRSVFWRSFGRDGDFRRTKRRRGVPRKALHTLPHGVTAVPTTASKLSKIRQMGFQLLPVGKLSWSDKSAPSRENLKDRSAAALEERTVQCPESLLDSDGASLHYRASDSFTAGPQMKHRQSRHPVRPGSSPRLARKARAELFRDRARATSLLIVGLKSGMEMDGDPKTHCMIGRAALGIEGLETILGR